MITFFYSAHTETNDQIKILEILFDYMDWFFSFGF